MTTMQARAETNIVKVPEREFLELTQAALEPPFEGYVDFYGYHTLAGGWCMAGWTTRQDDLLTRLGRVEVRFERNTIEGEPLLLTFERNDVVGREAVGFLIFLPAPDDGAGRLLSLGLLCRAGTTQYLTPVDTAYQLRDAELLKRLNFIVMGVASGPARDIMDVRLHGRRDQVQTGLIEYYGYHQTAGGWFFTGWVGRSWLETAPPERLLITSDGADVYAATVACLYSRTDLPESAVGVLFFVPGKHDIIGNLKGISLRLGDVTTVMQPVINLPHLREAELGARVKADVGQTRPGPYRDRMANILARRPYAGEDTLDALSPAILLYVDHAFTCGPGGLLLMGWMLAKPEEVREVRVRCGEQVAVLQPQSFVRIERLDVMEGYGKFGFEDSNCGFITYVPDIVQPDMKIYIEVETRRFEIRYRNIPAPAPGGISAIKLLLGAVDVRYGDLVPAFDRVLGPAVEAMNAERLAPRVGRQVTDYGVVPQHPKYSVLVPLFGRLDFVEYQMGLFSARASNADVEYVFVLDDPPKKREAQQLFASVFARFGIPFRAVLLERNLGFAPANNVGMEYCHGEYLVYLNSDVFPGSLDWLERLSARLEAEPGLGAVGPLLQFVDGAVQHRGMYFERLEEYGNLYFCQHVDKGLQYTGAGGMEYFIGITGACMMLRRDLAVRLGGFDETYAIGDFEDSDLCLKIQELGFGCGVDHDVMLYHLERKSQLSGALTWRANLTAYNAWQHERRWAKTIAQKQAQEFKVPA